MRRWPAGCFAWGLTPVLLGSKADEEWLQVVRGTGVGIRNLIGRTSPRQVVELARGATGAIGNDTGVMHVVTLAGCPSLVLYGSDSPPGRRRAARRRQRRQGSWRPEGRPARPVRGRGRRVAAIPPALTLTWVGAPFT